MKLRGEKDPLSYILLDGYRPEQPTMDHDCKLPWAWSMLHDLRKMNSQKWQIGRVLLSCISSLLSPRTQTIAWCLKLTRVSIPMEA